MPDPGRAETLAGFDVSRETSERLDILVRELGRWQTVKNLVGPATLSEVWTRHVADSLQLLFCAPEAKLWLDLGSGAGFPGLVLGCALAGRAGAEVHLVESNGRKCGFLRHVRRLAELPVTVHEGRIEAVLPGLEVLPEVVTARALAPLAQLLAWTRPLLTRGAVGLFPKGRGVEAELTEARESPTLVPWAFHHELIPSRTDRDGRIVRMIAPGSSHERAHMIAPA